MIYTSGSTGKPKGVLIEHRSLVNYATAAAREYEITPEDRVLQFSSISFDASVEEIFVPLTQGATLVLRTDAMISSIESFLEACAAHRITVLGLPTAYWHELVVQIDEQNLKVPPSLRLVIVGGEKALPERLRVWQRRPGKRIRFVNSYGPTEATVVATMYSVPAGTPPETIKGELPIGRAVAGAELHILDSDLKPVPNGGVGELYIGGPGVARGYLKRLELTAQRFVPNPADARRQLYKTGDLVRRRPDGNLEFVGRADFQVKIRGFRIELGEIESALNQHPAVRESVVLAREDAPGEKRLVAYVVQCAPVRGADLRAFLGKKIPGYMIPADYMFLERFPLTPNGKIDRNALPEPAGIEADFPADWNKPRTPLEMQLQLIFARHFNRPQVEIDTSFFELGGDSLQALKLIVEIERAIGKKLPLGILYQAPTVEALAKFIEDQEKTEWSSLVQLQPHGSDAPFFLVHTTPGDVLGYGNLVYHLGNDQPCYGFQSLALGDSGQSHATIEEMAAHYVKLLRTVQSHGPYRLGGWCYGGIVSVEMAQQLRAAGEEIDFLALIETPAPRPALNLHFYFYYLRRVGIVLNMAPAQWKTYFTAKVNYYRGIEAANRMRFMRAEVPEGCHDPAAEEKNRLIEKLEFVYNANLAALSRYESRPYPGKVVLFNAEIRDPAVLPDPFYGWKGLAREIETHVISGDHDTILMEPHVRTLSQKLKAYLSRSRFSKVSCAIANAALVIEEAVCGCLNSISSVLTIAF